MKNNIRNLFGKDEEQTIWQFMDKFFTPGYLADILAAREQGSQLRW